MPALKRNRYDFLSVNIIELGNRLQHHQRAEDFPLGGRGWGDTFLNLYQRGLLLIRPLFLFLTVEAANDFSH